MSSKVLEKEVIKILQRSTVVGSVLKLPEEQLSQKLHIAVKKKIDSIGGKWNRSAKGFSFKSDPNVLIEKLREGQAINSKKQYQFFRTPDDIADLMIDMIKNSEFELNNQTKILEPSAGDGSLLFKIPHFVKHIHYCELNPEMAKGLEAVGKTNTKLVGNDFLKMPIIPKYFYNLIVANPPFTRGQYATHIQKMYQHLEYGGFIVTIASASWKTATRGNDKQFKEWLDTVNYEHEVLPQGTFKESGTMVKKTLLVIRKL